MTRIGMHRGWSVDTGESHGGRAVVFCNRFYWPDYSATAQMLADLAEGLADRGWVVTVITSAGMYEGTVSTALPAEEYRNGVRILRVRSIPLQRHRLSGRVVAYLSYMIGACHRAMRLERQDYYVAMSDPPFIIAVVLLVARLRAGRTIYWVQDLFPQLAAKLGVIHEQGIPYRVAERLARWVNRRCDLVVALGPRMAQALVAAGAQPRSTTWVHNWADASAIRPIPAEDNDFLDEHDLRGRFVILYSGNAGRAHTFDAVLHAARELRDDWRFVFLFIGGGSRMAELRGVAKAESLVNIRFLGYMPRERLAWSLSAASVSLVTEHPDVVGLLVPSKTYGILASGRPIIFIGDAASDVARVVREAECGVVISPENGDGLVLTLREWQADSPLVAAMGERARAAAKARYNRRHATESWDAAVTAIGGMPSAVSYGG